MGFVFKKDESVALNAGKGGSLDTGVHSVKIVGAYLKQTEKGNNVIDLEFEGKTGGKVSIFGMCIDEKWVSGAENYDYARWQELASVANMQTGAVAPCKRKNFDGTEEDANAFTELMGLEVQVAIQVEYDVYQNKEKKRRNLTRTFFANGQSMAEKQSNTDAKQSISLGKNMKDYFTKTHKTWKADGGGSTTAETTQEPVDTADAASLI